MDRVSYCPGCKRHLRVVLGASFNRKVDSCDGLQPWCRECDWKGKATLAEAWNRFSRVLAKEPQSQLAWNEELYLSMLGDEPTCNWCGSSCREWGIGHWIDRIDSRAPHLPSNCVVCCTPCNFHKGHKPNYLHEQFLSTLLVSCPQFPRGIGRYPWGKIPWGDIPSSSKVFRRVSAPDLSEFVVPDPQLTLRGVA